MIKFTVVILIGLLLTVLLKQLRQEYAFLTRLAIICIAVVSSVAGASVVIDKISSVAAVSEIDTAYILIMVKVVGISVITQTAGNICRDCGESALAGVAEFAGKIVIAGISLPVIEKLIELSVELLS